MLYKLIIKTEKENISDHFDDLDKAITYTNYMLNNNFDNIKSAIIHKGDLLKDVFIDSGIVVSFRTIK